MASGKGESKIAWVSPNGTLSVYRTSDQTVSNIGEAVAAGTSPSIAALANGDFVTAYVSGGTLRIINTNGVPANTGVAVAPNTSPSIAADVAGGWQIAVSGTDNHVLTYNSSGQTKHLTAVMKAGTSPAIAALTVLSTACTINVFKQLGAPSGVWAADFKCSLTPGDTVTGFNVYGVDEFEKAMIGVGPWVMTGKTIGVQTKGFHGNSGPGDFDEDPQPINHEDEIQAEAIVVRPDGTTYSAWTNEVSGDFGWN